MQPDTVLSEQQHSQSYGPITTTSQPNGAGQAGLANSAAGAAHALAGWAISSLSKQLASGEAHSSMSAAPALSSSAGAGGMSGQAYQSNAGLSVPGGFGAASSTSGSPRASTDSWSSAPAQQAQASNSRQPTVPPARAPSTTVPGFGLTKSMYNKPAASGSGSGGMKLGGAKAKGKSTTNSALDEVMGDWDDEGPENAWGTDDLIDVNADDDDWGKSETCLLA